MAAPTFALRSTGKLTPDKEQEFVNSPWEPQLSSIPNLGKASQECLKGAGIETTYNLCGQFLMLQQPGDNTQQRCDKFVQFLSEAGVHSSLLSVLTYAVAKKLNSELDTRHGIRTSPREHTFSFTKKEEEATTH
jgi:hypothetical protein